MNYARLTVEQIMSTALIVARPDEAVDEADFDMRLAGIHHIPVVDSRNHLVGLVAQRDLLLAFARNGKKPVRIRDIMITRVATVAPDAPAHHAVQVLLDRKIGCLPVVAEDGQLVGLVTATDFLNLAHEVLAGAQHAHTSRWAD